AGRVRHAQQGAAYYSGYPDARQYFATHAGASAKKTRIAAPSALVAKIEWNTYGKRDFASFPDMMAATRISLPRCRSACGQGSRLFSQPLRFKKVDVLTAKL